MEGIEIQIPVTAEQMEKIRNAWVGMKLVRFNFREIEAEERKCNIVQTDIIRCVDCASRDTSMCGFRDIISGRQQTRDDDFCSYARRRPDGHSRL